MSDAEIKPPCPKCGSARTGRIKRVGVLQTYVFHRFGKFPWECSSCRNQFLANNRGRLKRKRRTTGEVHLPPIA